MWSNIPSTNSQGWYAWILLLVLCTSFQLLVVA
jgi:hypothetical protein